MVPSKRRLRTQPQEIVLIGLVWRLVGNLLGLGTTSLSARQEVIPYLEPAEWSAGCSGRGDWAAGTGQRIPPQLRHCLHRTATARTASLQPGAAARGAPAAFLKSLLGAVTQASPGPSAGDLALCCKRATVLPASALPARSHPDPGPERLPWTWD